MYQVIITIDLYFIMKTENFMLNVFNLQWRYLQIIVKWTNQEAGQCSFSIFNNINILLQK